jgi:FkbM family methyltransferase
MLEMKKDLVDMCRRHNVRVIYDCGSRDALDGIELLNRLGSEELHIFECNPEAIQLCRKNISLYKENAKIFLNEVAVADVEGWLDFHSIDPSRTITSHSDGNIGASSLFKPNPAYPKESYTTNTIKVKATTLDKYCSTHKPPDLLWMDLQGAELMAIRGAEAVLESVSFIHIEVAFRPVYVGQPMFYEIHGNLNRRFKLYRLYDVSLLERCVRTFAGPLNRFISVGHWFTNAIYVNRRLI